MEKQLKMMKVILYLYERCKELVEMGMPMALLRENRIFEKIIAIKYDVANKDLQKFDDYWQMIDEFYHGLLETNA